jgi:hypothetical protein
VNTPTPLFIVGLQKSGTTLLARLLEETGLVDKPFRAEGDEFWGNTPPFAPIGYPAGAAYQRHGGARGHMMDAEDATADVIESMRTRWEVLDSTAAVILNKNPYNTVRLSWLRAIFPEAVIVAMVRAPVPNVFSLCKKFHPHEQGGLPPEDGWWGVKPPDWRSLRSDDSVEQCARQWAAVNSILDRDRALADLVLSYRELCARPGNCIADILARAGVDCTNVNVASAPITCFDDEFTRGSRLRSKNRYYREMKSLATPAVTQEPIEIEAFSRRDLAVVETICSAVESKFPELRP